LNVPNRSLFRARFVDWWKVVQISIALPFGIVIIPLLAEGLAGALPRETPKWLPGLAIILSVIINFVLWIWGLVAQLIGYSIDTPQDRLAYPRYFFRRRVRISEIHDANAQTITSRRKSDYGRIVGDTRPTTTVSRTYQINLSGDFGLRHVAFSTKGRRDLFLSLLRQAVPTVRITRWS
jgi:hypothetical protein